MKHRLPAVLGVFVLIVLLAPTAGACSCGVGDLRDALAESDAAIIGRFVSKGEPTPGPNGIMSTGDEVPYRFVIEDEIKGDLPARVEVWSAVSGASCGLEVSPDEIIGLFLDRNERRWTSSLCSQVDPDALRGAAGPLPKPNGEGAARFLVGGSYGPARLLALDGEGRTLRYAQEPGQVTDIDVCRGGDVFVELVQGVEENTWRRRAIAIRDVETFDVRREFRHRLLETPDGQQYPKVDTIRCVDERGDSIVALIERDEGVRLLVRLDGERPTVLYEGKPGGVDLGHNRSPAFVATGGAKPKLVAIDVLTGDRTEHGALPRDARQIVANVDGTLIAGYSQNWRTPHVFVRDVPEGTFREARTKRPSRLAWVEERRFATFTTYAEVIVYNEALETVATWKDWGGGDAPHVIDGAIYGVGHSGLSSADAMTGRQRILRRFESPELYALAVLDPPRVLSTALPASNRLLLGVAIGAAILLAGAGLLISRRSR